MNHLVPLENNGFAIDPRLQDRGLTISKGWSEELAEQLVIRSRESAIQLATPRDGLVARSLPYCL